MPVTSVPDSDLYSKANPKWYDHVVVWGVAALLAYRFYWVVTRFAVNLFFFDEWDIYEGLFRGWPWWRFFLQEHGPHRQGLGVTLVVWLLRATHWDSRTQAYAIAAAILAAMLLALRLKTTVIGRLQFFDVIIPILFLGLGQWEVLLSAPGPSAQAVPLLLLIAYCLAWAQQRAWLRYTGISLLNFLLIFTGYGIFIAVITVLLSAVDGWQRWRTGLKPTGAIVLWITSALSLALFFYGYVFNPAADCYQFPYRNPAAYPWFMGLMFAKFLGIKHGATVPALLGIVALIVLVSVLARSLWRLLRGFNRVDRVTVILTGFTFIYAAAAAIGRVCLGMEAASSSRNITLLIPGFVGIYFCLLMRPASYKRTLMMTMLLVAVLPGCIQRNHKEIEGFSGMKRAWKDCYRANENIQYCDQISHWPLYPHPEAIQLQEKLKLLKQNHLNLYSSND